MPARTAFSDVAPIANPPWLAHVGAIVARAPLAFGLAALSGAAYATAFPPLSWSIAAWVALVPLLVACASLSPLRAAAAGMIWTAMGAAGVASFLPGMLNRYFGLAPAASYLAALAAVVVLHGIYISAYAGWVAWLVRRRAAHPLLLAAGWVACELARSYGTLGSPWALAAYSQLRWTRLIQTADLAGAYGIGLLVAGVNACLAAALVPALRGRRPLRAAAAVAAALAAAFVYGEWRLGQDFGSGAPVRVAVVQAGAPAAAPAARAARLARHMALSAAAPADLFVWPEYAVETDLEEASPARDAVLRVAAAAGADLVVGGPHRLPSASGPRFHNSAWLVRDGRVAARYDKQRLVPFAEEERLAWLFGPAATAYAPGRGAAVLPGTRLRLGALLCLESMSPELARAAARAGAEVLVNLSNDAWFGQVEAARQQLDIATLRAVETRRFLVRAAATGVSAVIDPHGRALAESGFDTQQVLHASVRASRVGSPYQRCGDAIAWAVVLLAAAASLRLLRRRAVGDKEVSVKQFPMLVVLASCLAVGVAGAARAGAPQPDTRQGDFAHVCQGGANKGQPCSVATQDADCPGSACVPATLSKTIPGTLTIIAHDTVTDWANGGATNRAVTVMLEVKAPDGSRRMLASTYQNVLAPSEPPAAPGNVVALPIDEAAVQTLAAAVGGLLFAHPEATITQQLQTLFATTGVPALVAVKDRRVDSADHTGDGLATVLRFKVRIQFLEGL